MKLVDFIKMIKLDDDGNRPLIIAFGACDRRYNIKYSVNTATNQIIFKKGGSTKTDICNKTTINQFISHISLINHLQYNFVYQDDDNVLYELQCFVFNKDQEYSILMIPLNDKISQ